MWRQQVSFLTIRMVLNHMSGEQRSKVRAYQHVSPPSRFRTVTVQYLRETGTITISGSLQNAWNILRSDIVFVSVFLFVCFILKSFTS